MHSKSSPAQLLPPRPSHTRRHQHLHLSTDAHQSWQRQSFHLGAVMSTHMVLSPCAIMSHFPSNSPVSTAAAKDHATADVTAGLAWLHGSSLCTGVFITPNRMLCPRCVCTSWQAASSLVVKRRHATDNTVLSVTCDPSDCFLANSILDIVIIGVSPKFAEAAGVTSVPIAWPQSSAYKATHRTSVPPSPAVGPGYRLYR